MLLQLISSLCTQPNFRIGFEEAAQPTVSDIERRNLLSFRIVGAGPTGVEFAAELHDLIKSDIKRYYGEKLARLARITLYDVAPRMLGGFEHGLAEYVGHIHECWIY